MPSVQTITRHSPDELRCPACDARKDLWRRSHDSQQFAASLQTAPCQRQPFDLATSWSALVISLLKLLLNV